MTATDASVYERRPPAAEEITLILSATDAPNPEPSIVVPALDEEITIGALSSGARRGSPPPVSRRKS